MNREEEIIELAQSAKVSQKATGRSSREFAEFADALAHDPESARLAEEDKRRHRERNECAFGQDFDRADWKAI